MISRDNLLGSYSVGPTLRFQSAELEQSFLEHFVRKSLLMIRFALVMALGMYTFFYILDVLLELDNLPFTALFRFVIVPIPLIFTIIHSFRSDFVKRSELLICIPILVASLSHSALAIGNTLPTGYFLLATILSLLFIHLFSGLRFHFAIMIGIGLIIVFNLTQIFWVSLDLITLLFENFFLVSGLLLAIVANYNIERFARIDFIHRLERENFVQEIEAAKIQHELLLQNILPRSVVEELQRNGHVEPKYFPDVTVMFIDIVDFTRISQRVDARDLLETLNNFVSKVDSILSHYHVEKLKTMGDAYICAGGIPEQNATHALDCCLAAMEIVQLVEDQPLWFGQKLEVRIGIHTGPVVAGVIGTHKFAFDIWGDTVNLASRLENASEPLRINISNSTLERVRGHFVFEERGKLPIKGKGLTPMYFIGPLPQSLPYIAAG